MCNINAIVKWQKFSHVISSTTFILYLSLGNLRSHGSVGHILIGTRFLLQDTANQIEPKL